jgi:hypothetical protein
MVYRTANPDHIAENIPYFKGGKYDVVVTMYARPGTMESLLQRGAVSRHGVTGLTSGILIAHGYDRMPTIQSGKVKQVHVKAENNMVTFGLRGTGPDGSVAMYNSLVIGFKVETLDEFSRRINGK